MNDIAEYKPTTSPYEVLVHLNDKIIAGDLKTFDALKQYAAVLPEAPRTQTILKKAFDLQRQLYWGFFKGIGPDTYGRVWSQVVMPDRTYPFAGDLKRYNSISDIYMGLIDIHGYTKFCHKNRANMSMLDIFDRMIQEDIPQIASRLGVVSRRARGDEILLLGASAEDVLETVLRIMDYFSRKSKMTESAKLRARADTSFPEFQIAAGIAGGQKHTALIITRDGDLSGDIVNTAARLQARAGKISPEHNKILITTQTHQKMRGRAEKTERWLIEGVDFFNTGSVEFKGLSLSVHDIVFVERDGYRVAYREIMEELYESLDKGMWKSRIFEDSIRLFSAIVANFSSATSTSLEIANSFRPVSKAGFPARIKAAVEHFRAERFERAVADFGLMVRDLAAIPGMDELALEYLVAIQKNYEIIIASFVDSIDREIDTHTETLFSPTEFRSFTTLKAHSGLFGKSLDIARTRVRGRKAIWYRVADEAAPTLHVAIQSKK